MLRSFMRSAPRSIARLSPSSVRPAFTSTIKSKIALQTPRIACAAFSTTRARFDEHSQALAAKLEREIELEQAESSAEASSDSNVQAFFDENSAWELEDKAGEQDVFLTRKYEDETITVHFSISEFNDPTEDQFENDFDPALSDEEDMDLQSGGANTKGSVNRGGTANKNFKVAPEDSIAPADREELRDEEDEGSYGPAARVSVEVLVQRPSKGALKFILTAHEGEIQIEHLIQLPQSLSTGKPQDLLRTHNESLYTGPPFHQLDEEVQTMLQQYLEARGISEKLGNFIPEFIDVKEQKEYLGWLRRVKEFVD